MRDLTFKTKSQLTVTGLGSEQSLGHILQRGCPNSCGLVSVMDRRALLAKLGPFLSFLTRFHPVSDGSKNVLVINLFKPWHNICRFKNSTKTSVSDKLECNRCAWSASVWKNCFLPLLSLISRYISFFSLRFFSLLSFLHMTQSLSPSLHQNCHFQTHQWTCPPDYSPAFAEQRSLHRPGNKIKKMWLCKRKIIAQVERKEDLCFLNCPATQHLISHALLHVTELQ